MADYPRQGNRDRTIRGHAEQIRRLRTRMPASAGDSVSLFRLGNGTDGDGQVNNAGGWSTNGPSPYFMRQGDLVIFQGGFLYSAVSPSDPGYSIRNRLITAGQVPAEFLPVSASGATRIFGIDTNTAITSGRVLWNISYSQAGNDFRLGAQNTAAPPGTAPWGCLDDGNIHLVMVNAAWSMSPGAGEYPA